VNRVLAPPEPITFYAHRGVCNYCRSPVFMARDPVTYQLAPNVCWCIACGQRYFVIIEGTLEEFDQMQWEQKAMLDIVEGRGSVH